MTSSILFLWWSFAASKTNAAVSAAVLQKRPAALLSPLAVVQRLPCCTAKWCLLHCKVTRYIFTSENAGLRFAAVLF